MSTAKQDSGPRTVPLCRIIYKINQRLFRAAKKRNGSKKKSKPATPVCFSVSHWNTNLLHGRVTRSWARLFHGAAPVYTLRLRYMCMPLLGDEELMVPNWDIHVLSLAVESLSAASQW